MPTTSARLYLFLLTGILSLLGASGGLGYYFFAILPQREAVEAARLAEESEQDLLLARATTAEVTPSPSPAQPAPAPAVMDAVPWTIGPSGREIKFSPKTPGAPPLATGMPSRTRDDTAAYDPLATSSTTGTMPVAAPAVTDDCLAYGNEVDFTRGSGITVVGRQGELCLEIERPRVDLLIAPDRECGPEGKRHRVDELDCRLRVCLRARPAAYGGAPGVGSGVGAGSGSSETVPQRLARWHAGGQARPTGNQAADERPAAESLTPPIENYAFGTDPARWFSDVPGMPIYQAADIFPGIDLACYAQATRLEFIFTVHPGGDPSEIRMEFDGIENAVVAPDGTLVLEVEAGRILQHAPRVYRIVDNVPVPVQGRFEVDGSLTRFTLDDPATPANDTEQRQPALDSLTYLGGSGDDVAYAVAVDNDGNTYIAGETTSRRFSGSGAEAQNEPNNANVFVTKYRAQDGRPVYTTFLGGSSEDRALGLATGPNGQVAICGETLSSDFPVVGANAMVAGESWNAFVTVLDASGRVDRVSTLLGGSGDDRAFGIGFQPDGTLLVCGETASADFEATHTFGPGGDAKDAFLARLTPEGALIGVTRLGGRGADAAYAMAVLPDGLTALGGETRSRDFPTVEAFQAEPQGGVDGFVAILSATGDALRYATYLGAENDDRIYGLSTDSAGNLYVAGETASLDLPVRQAFQPVFGGGMWDAFAGRLEGRPWRPRYLTYLGGSGDDRAFSVVADASGNAHVIGSTSSTNLPVRAAPQANHGGGVWDGFVARLDVSGQNLLYGTFLGGAGDDMLFAGAISGGRYLTVGGATTSTDLTTINPLQDRFSGGLQDAMAARVIPPFSKGPALRKVPADVQAGGPAYDFYMAAYETSNAEFARFLNDAEANTHNARGTNLYFDAQGNIWINPAMQADRDEVFAVSQSRIEYNPAFPVGMRYFVTPRVPVIGGSYTNHPVTGVSWFGAVKYCNWLTIDTGRGENALCFREGTNTLDWAPVTSTATNWANGIFSIEERKAWLAHGGFRLPMDNCATPLDLDPLAFRVSQADMTAFLNALDTPGGATGRPVTIDRKGNVWMHPAMERPRDVLFSREDSGIEFDPGARLGTRFRVAPAAANEIASGVSIFGAMKYCNWLPLQRGGTPEALPYREGPWPADWAPATCGVMTWRNGSFDARDFEKWARSTPLRLPLDTLPESAARETAADFSGKDMWANPFNEFYAAAASQGRTNTLYGFGRSALTARDANFMTAGLLSSPDTTPVGFFDGQETTAARTTHTNANAFGIYDLSGNVAEWLTDPGLGGASNTTRALAGGSWAARLPPLTQRNAAPPWSTSHNGGFRAMTTFPADTGAYPYVVRIPYRVCLCGCGVSEADAVTPTPADLISTEEPEGIGRDEDEDDDELIPVDPGLFPPPGTGGGGGFKPGTGDKEPPLDDDDDDDDEDDDDDDDEDEDDDDDDEPGPGVSPSGV